MKLGEKILELRKKQGLSQEQLGEKINVTRQTISNWELGETSPNPEQLKLISKELKISIDELLDNDIKAVLVEKVSNTEKLAGLVLRVLKCLGIIFIVITVIDVISLVLFILNVILPKKILILKVLNILPLIVLLVLLGVGAYGLVKLNMDYKDIIEIENHAYVYYGCGLIMLLSSIVGLKIKK